MKTINKTILTILTLAGLMFLSGCASMTPYAETSAQLQMEMEAMSRGEVFKVAPQDEFQNMLYANEGDNENFKKLTGMSLAEAKGKQWILITSFSGYGEVKRWQMFVDSKWDIQPGDIIDYIRKRGPVKTLVRVDFTGLCWNLIAGWYTCHNEGAEFPLIKMPGQILGVVCRNTEFSCRNDVSAGTALGFGRKMLSASEYRGVEAESQQPMQEDDYNFNQSLGINICAECEDDDKVIYVD